MSIYSNLNFAPVRIQMQPLISFYWCVYYATVVRYRKSLPSKRPARLWYKVELIVYCLKLTLSSCPGGLPGPGVRAGIGEEWGVERRLVALMRWDYLLTTGTSRQ
jgi:hypothetical protein